MVNEASAFDMNALDSRIRELVAYARERDGEDRTTLFRNLVDLFLTGKAPQKDPTRSQLLDVLEALVPHVEADSRRTVADLVANMSSPPLDLALRLCRDRASLISNLLKNVAFDEDDILELIECTGREHHQILASRDDLSANIWIALARAAPNAPPFDHQSTLALWSDDLGIMRTASAATGTNGAASAIITPLRSDQINHSKTGGKIRPIGKPSIRIIRTDEDLMAERVRSTETGDAAAQTQDSTEAVDITTNVTAIREDTTTPLDHESIPSHKAADLDPELQKFIGDEKKASPLKDPGPGGWAWRSDRDGIISTLSPKGLELLGNGMENTGTTVLDILALNHKIGHPVARAFQRRSTIHDAPIFLTSMDPAHQHWTLEATPFFSNCGGIFEGYEGVLTPVVAAKKKELLPSEEDASALFLDEVAPARRAAIGAGNAFTQTPNATHGETVASATNKEPKIQQASTATQKTHTATSPGLNVTTERLATSALEEVISETLKPLTDALAGQKSKTETPAVTASPDNPDNLNLAEVRSTLDLLEEALARLSVAGKNAGGIQVRLQSEIASACARTLRDLLIKQ